MATKIAIFFWGCNKLDRRACEYLLLSLNKHQTLFEFEIHNPECFEHGPKGRGQVNFDDDKIFQQFRDNLKLYQTEIKEIISDPNNVFDESGSALTKYAIAVIERKVKNEFYYVSDRPLAIISIGDWKKKYAPPSVLEFLLSTIIGAAVDLQDNEDQLAMHIATRGCIFDYNDSLEGARYSVLINHICNGCTKRIKKVFGEKFYGELKKITQKDWIGNPADSGSIAYDLKRVFFYSLTKTKGLKASLVERIGQKITDIFTETVAKTVIAILIGLLLGALGLSSIYQLMK